MTLELVHHDHSTAKAIRQTLIDVHAEVYADQKDDPFVQRFPWFVDHWGGNPGFTCVIGYEQGEPVGYPAALPRQPSVRRHAPHPARLNSAIRP
ncbi:hypothetical protein [Streptomyces sp. NPDC089915]|uniref:hypothetical protein n=1 Tax=Streptomyces sp. NPDC089915 TaxID=3155186 RepID=UPI003430045B